MVSKMPLKKSLQRSCVGVIAKGAEGADGGNPMRKRGMLKVAWMCFGWAQACIGSRYILIARFTA